jgi:serine/threonine protein kinase
MGVEVQIGAGSHWRLRGEQAWINGRAVAPMYRALSTVVKGRASPGTVPFDHSRTGGLGSPRPSQLPPAVHRRVTDVRPIVFGKYCLLERISVGGMAEVYRARPFDVPASSRFLALKRILPSLAADDEFITMFVDEARIAVQLNHRNVCQIYELGRHDGSFFIVMEYIAGKDVLAMQNWFRKKRRIMNPVQAAWIAARVCDGLDYAHRKADDDGEPLRIIHRDISPQNVIVSYDGDVKLIDFGIARAATTNQVTQVGVLKGKFGYMSPEQADGLEIDHRSDIFALGTLLWEMLTARRLFHGDSDFATLEQVRSAPIEPPSARNSAVPPELDRIVLRALERDRDDRYAWASELGTDLDAFIASHASGYEDGTLRRWMANNFEAEIRDEVARREAFKRFVSPSDVHRWYAEHPDVRVATLGEGVSGSAVVGPSGSSGVSDQGSGPVVPAGELDLGIVVDDGDISITVDHMEGLANRSVIETASLPSPRRRGLGGAVAAILLVVIAAAAIAFFALPRTAPVGALRIADPGVAGAQILVDGHPVEGTPPLELPGLTVGDHIVEIRADGYEPALVTVEVTPDAVAEVAPVLEPIDLAPAALTLTLSDPEARVFVDRAEVLGSGARREVTLSPEEPHVIEVLAPGTFVAELPVELGAGVRDARTVELRPVMGTVTVGSQPAGDVYVDGEQLGTTDQQITIEGFDVRQPIRIEIRPRSPSFRSHEQTIVFDTIYDVRIHPSLPRIGQEQVQEEPAWGTLAVREGSDWYRVFVDGRDTGFVTPIPEDAPLALDAGTREVSFVRPGEERATRVTVVAGELVVVDVPEP